MTADEVYRYLRNMSACRPLSSITTGELACHFDASHEQVVLALFELEAAGRVALVNTVRVVEVN